MSDFSSDFSAFMTQRKEASDACVNGDFGPLDNCSTHTSPATLFGPKGDCVQGADQVNSTNARSARMFDLGSENAFEVMHHAADGSIGYWVGVQRSVVRMKGQERAIPMDLRVTEIFRREGDQWKLIHRQADRLAADGNALQSAS